MELMAKNCYYSRGLADHPHGYEHLCPNIRFTKIFCKAEIQSIPYIEDRHTPADPENVFLAQRKAANLLNIISYDENNSQVTENAMLALIPGAEQSKVSKTEQSELKPSTSKKAFYPVQPKQPSESSSECVSEDSEVRTEQLRKQWLKSTTTTFEFDKIDYSLSIFR